MGIKVSRHNGKIVTRSKVFMTVCTEPRALLSAPPPPPALPNSKMITIFDPEPPGSQQLFQVLQYPVSRFRV